ncbi:MAG: hypothetical protein IKW46_02655 [Bacteroidaceae bacterium]|nr:hypothetical protein [Bacteroidaceae bacterium]
MKKTLLTFIFAIAATFAVAQTKTFTDNLTISMDGEVIDSQASTITVKKESDNTYTLALNNFLLMGEGIGNIVINGITANEENSIKNFSVEQNITITEGDSEGVEFWLGPELGEIPVALNGKMTEGSLYCNINIEDLGVAVTFGTDIAKTFSYDEDLTVIMDGEILDSQRTTIYVDEKTNGTYTLALNNFLLLGEGIGNIVINGITANEENSIKNFSVEQNITITEGDSEGVEFWLGPELGEIPVALNGKMTEHKLYCNINIEDLGVAVTFGQADLTGINNVESENGANVIYDLTGRKVNEINAAGIYIVNGKKVLVK